jgi:hypothetical protein
LNAEFAEFAEKSREFFSEGLAVSAFNVKSRAMRRATADLLPRWS